MSVPGWSDDGGFEGFEERSLRILPVWFMEERVQGWKVFIEGIQSGVAGFRFERTTINQSEGSSFSYSVECRTDTVSSQKDEMLIRHDEAKTSSVDSTEDHAGVTIIAADNAECPDSFTGQVGGALDVWLVWSKA